MTKMIKLFALGSNGSGQLGIGHQDDTATPELCKFDEEDFASTNPGDQIVKIVSGGNHTLVLFESGIVFAAGSNKHRECCLLHVSHTSTFRRVLLHGVTQVNEVMDFIDVSATWEASFLLGRDGCVYVFGVGSKGELGIGPNVSATGDISGTQTADFGERFPRIKQLHSAMRHTIAIDDEGGVYGWGSCRKGEIGAELARHKVMWTPERLNVPFDYQRVVVGRNFTILLSTHMCKGFGHRQVLEEITENEELLLKGDVDAGWSTVYTLFEKRVEAFGGNDRGQCPSDDLPDLSKIAAGSEHCLGLAKDGRVVAWGWGEHGNCGQSTDSRGNIAGRWNVLPVPLEDHEEVLNIAAGCATSFALVGRKP